MLDGLIIGRILRWGKSGCAETNERLSKAFHIDRRTIIRSIKKLVHSEWLAPLYPTKRLRILYVNPEKLTAGPLFGKKGGGKLSPKKVRLWWQNVTLSDLRSEYSENQLTFEHLAQAVAKSKTAFYKYPPKTEKQRQLAKLRR